MEKDQSVFIFLLPSFRCTPLAQKEKKLANAYRSDGIITHPLGLDAGKKLWQKNILWCHHASATVYVVSLLTRICYRSWLHIIKAKCPITPNLCIQKMRLMRANRRISFRSDPLRPTQQQRVHSQHTFPSWMQNSRGRIRREEHNFF